MMDKGMGKRKHWQGNDWQGNWEKKNAGTWVCHDRRQILLSFIPLPIILPSLLVPQPVTVLGCQELVFYRAQPKRPQRKANR